MADDSNRPPSPDATDASGSTEEVVARGRAARTPFVLLGSVAVTIWAVVAVVALGLLTIWWLG
jgi:hypothetical protein